MAQRSEIKTRVSGTEANTTGVGKFLQDTWSVLEIKLLLLARGWLLHLIRPLLFPLAIFFWLNVMAPDDPETARRMISGAIIFGITISTINMLTQQMIIDRFSGRLKLLITMPLRKSAYAAGIIVFATVQIIPSIALLLVVASVAGVDYQVEWVFFILLVPILLTMSGLTFIIVGFAPTQEAGGILANLMGIGFVILSPVFFTMDQAPVILRVVGWVSPMRYAADGIMKSLSGRTDVGLEFAILSAFAVAVMTLGIWKMTWQDQ